MKISEHLLKFPKYLPNDLEGLMFYYPEKFPRIVTEFELIALKIADSPQAFREYGEAMRTELGAGFEKIQTEFEAGSTTDIAFLIAVDEKIHKLYCYRFWIVNYLFPDGPVHDFVVDNLQDLIRKFTDVGENIEEYEEKVVNAQRDLLQSDYADLYLTQALDGAKMLKALEKQPDTAKLLPRITKLIDEHSDDNTAHINQYWDKIYEFLVKGKNAKLKEALAIPLSLVEMRSSMLPLYSMLTHAVEFRIQNVQLATRDGQMNTVIDDYRSQARNNLSKTDYELFDFCYEQAKNFSMYKDIMGRIDAKLLPFWFRLHDHLRAALQASGTNVQVSQTGPNAVWKNGPTAVIHHLVWYLPDNLKAKVMTPDTTPFDLKTL